MVKALLLFSGGLDSILAAKILTNQKIKVTPICFESYFFNCDLAKKSAKNLNLRLKVVDFSKEHLRIIKKPKYGLGKGMNPCIDCHLLMLKKAKKITRIKSDEPFDKLRTMKSKFDFIATGEVLGERPFSQDRKIFKLIEKELNLENQILRPLSAKLLPETLAEKKRLIKREKSFGFSGKSRKSQIALAKKFKIKEFPSPAGGCILTDPEYSKRLKELLKKIPKADGLDCQILRKGRVFWTPPTRHPDKFLILVGRNEKENEELKKFKKKGDLILEPENFPGPTVLIRGFGKEIKKEVINRAFEFLLHYSKKLPEEIKISLNEL